MASPRSVASSRSVSSLKSEPPTEKIPVLSGRRRGGLRRWRDGARILLGGFLPGALAGTQVAGLLFFLNGLRLAGWYTPGIWRQPLLWSLYLAYLLITLGREGVKPALSYLLFSLASSYFIMAGLALAYAATGSLLLADLGNSGASMAWIFSLLAAGFVIKMGGFGVRTVNGIESSPKNSSSSSAELPLKVLCPEV